MNKQSFLKRIRSLVLSSYIYRLNKCWQMVMFLKSAEGLQDCGAKLEWNAELCCWRVDCSLHPLVKAGWAGEGDSSVTLTFSSKEAGFTCQNIAKTAIPCVKTAFCSKGKMFIRIVPSFICFLFTCRRPWYMQTDLCWFVFLIAP